MPSPKTFWRRWDAHHRCSLAVCAEEFDGCTAAHRMYASVLCVPSGAGERGPSGVAVGLQRREGGIG